MLPSAGGDARMFSQDVDLLNEPIKDTIMRDVLNVAEKMTYVMNMKAREEKGGILRKWDFWGPLFLCLLLSLILWSQAADGDQGRSAFSLVFALIWIGSALVTLNAQFLGCSLSFFQSVCVLGYCLCPVVLAGFAFLFVPHIIAAVKLPITIAAVYWATGASTSFMASVSHPDKLALVVYPVWLYYAVVGWLILTM